MTISLNADVTRWLCLLAGLILLSMGVVFAIGPRRALAAWFAVPLYAATIGAIIGGAWWLYG